MSILFGVTYKDKITGFRGICTGRVSYISGCDQALLVPAVDKSGKKVDGEWFDVQRLEEVNAKKRIVLNNAPNPGFDAEAPKR